MSMCYRGRMRKTLVLLMISCLLGPAAWAQQRMFPEHAKPGAIKSVQYPEIKIDGRWYRLSPGVRLVDQRNTAILPTMLPDAGPVAYIQDAMGFISDLWLLTPQEAAAFPRQKK